MAIAHTTFGYDSCAFRENNLLKLNAILRIPFDLFKCILCLSKYRLL